MTPVATRRIRRVAARPWLVLAVALLISLVAVGCGGGGDSSADGTLAGLGEGNGSVPDAAELLPADVPVLMTINTSLDSEQLTLAGQLLEKFPGGQKLLDEALADLAGGGLDLETDVRPVLGSEVTIALLDVKPDDPPVAAVLEPADAAKLEELLSRDRDGDAPAWRVVDGRYVLADDEATLDAILGSAEQVSLAEQERFKEIMEALPAENLARLWIGPVVTQELVSQVGAENPAGMDGLEAIFSSQGTFEGAGAAVVAAEEGVRVVGLAKTTDAPEGSNGPIEILDLAPAGAIAYVSLRDLRETVDRFLTFALQQDPSVEAQIAQAEGFLGLTIEDDLLPLFENEHAIYVRPGSPIPEISIVLSPDDAEAAADLLKRLIAVAEIGGVEAESDTVEIDGNDVLRLRSQDLTLYVATLEGRIVLTTSEAGISDFGGSDTLKDDPRFAAAADAAGLPDETAALVYLDVAGVLQLATADSLLGGSDLVSGIDEQALANVEPLGSLIAFGTTASDEQRFAGLVTIE